MSESEEITDELRHRLAQFLSVEKTPEGYSEKTPKGNVINYVVSKYNPSLRIEHLHAR